MKTRSKNRRKNFLFFLINNCSWTSFSWKQVPWMQFTFYLCVSRWLDWGDFLCTGNEQQKMNFFLRRVEQTASSSRQYTSTYTLNYLPVWAMMKRNIIMNRCARKIEFCSYKLYFFLLIIFRFASKWKALSLNAIITAYFLIKLHEKREYL